MNHSIEDELEEIIIQYYELIFNGTIEKASEQFIDWDITEGSLIDYYSGMNKLNQKYKIVSLDEYIVSEFTRMNENKYMIEIMFIYLDIKKNKRKEKNVIKIKRNAKMEWKISSIIREIE